jgi:hypothetical protein
MPRTCRTGATTEHISKSCRHPALFAGNFFRVVLLLTPGSGSPSARALSFSPRATLPPGWHGACFTSDQQDAAHNTKREEDRMLTKTNNTKHVATWILVPAVALLTACGGIGGAGDDLAGEEFGDMDEDIGDMDEDIGDNAVEAQLSGKLAVPQLQPGTVAPELKQTMPTPAYVKDQVLELCNGGTMTVKNGEELTKQLGGDLTIELWMRAVDTEDQRIMTSDGLSLFIEQGRIKAELPGSVMEGLNIVASEWYHVAVVYADGEAQLFTNGIPSGPVAADAGQRPRGPVVFGGDAEQGQPYCGKLDNVRVTGQALYWGYFTPAQALKVLDNMVFAYDFDDLLGTKVEDLSGNGYHARLDDEAHMVAGKI